MDMKKLFYLLLSATLFACSSEQQQVEPESVLPENPEGLKYHTVTFDLKGELADFSSSEEPLTKAGGEDTTNLYVINVYSKSAAGGSYVEYAYGTFDRKEGMTVNLLEGNLYQFKVTMVRDARNSMYWTSDSTYYWGYGGVKLLNKFVISTSGIFNNDATEMYVPDFSSYKGMIPQIDRYYGELTDYTPVENGKIAVDLYRTVFGVRVNVNGLTEGKLNFNIMDRLFKFSADSVYTLDNIYQMPYLDDVVEFAPQGKVHTESIPLTVTWTNAAGDRTLDIYSGGFTVTRLKRTILNITLKQGVVSPTGVDFTMEQADITDGNTENIEGTINGGSDVEINPGA